jgi:hypothetical protein
MYDDDFKSEMLNNYDPDAKCFGIENKLQLKSYSKKKLHTFRSLRVRQNK